MDNVRIAISLLHFYFTDQTPRYMIYLLYIRCEALEYNTLSFLSL